MQTINIQQKEARCCTCGTNLKELGQARFCNETIDEDTFKEELYMCDGCGSKFHIRYDLFDEKGHINQFVFSEDVNNPHYHWQDNLTERQKKLIAEHLKVCGICNDRMTDEIATDAWFASIIHAAGRKRHV